MFNKLLLNDALLKNELPLGTFFHENILSVKNDFFPKVCLPISCLLWEKCSVSISSSKYEFYLKLL